MTASAPAPDPATRPLPRRLGLLALNLVAPGLGLVRVGRLRLGLVLLAVGPGATLVAGGLFRVLPPLRLGGWMTIMVALAAAWLVAVAAALVATWRASRRRTPLARWSRWYALIALLVVVGAVNEVALRLARGGYRSWRIVNEAMLPTLVDGTAFVADTSGRTPPAVGDIVLADGPGGVVYVKRVAALPGSTVAIRGGVPVIDGHAAAQRPLGIVRVEDMERPASARLLAERLPGDARTHRVLDLEVDAMLDEMPPRRVPAGHVFLLGDHRDRSADSRLARDEGGLGMVPVAGLRGRALFVYWAPGHFLDGHNLTH